MNKIMFEMQAMIGTYQFYANIDKDNIVEYEIDERIHGRNKLIGTSGKLDKDRSKSFIELIEKANIDKINKLVEETPILDIYTDSGYFSVFSLPHGYAFWEGYEELENMHYIYLAICLCDEDMVDMLLGEALANDNLSFNIKDIMNNLALKLSLDEEE